jgi:hypothetical protein
VAGFVRLLLQRNVQQGLTKLADIQRGPVFWGSGLEKFHCCVLHTHMWRHMQWSMGQTCIFSSHWFLCQIET